MTRFHFLEEESEKKISDFLKLEVTLPQSTKFKFVGDTKQKKILHITIPTGRLKLLLECDIIVTINEFAFTAMHTDRYDMLKTILINELASLTYDLNSDNYKLIKHDVITSKSVISSYSVDDVIKAQEMEAEIIKSISEQIKDGRLSLEKQGDGLESVTDDSEED